MYKLNRLKSVNHLTTLLTSTLHFSIGNVRSYTYRGRVIHPPPRGAAAGISDYVDADMSSTEYDEALSNNDNHNTYMRKVLPPELSLSKNMVKLTCDSAAGNGICDVYVVGTCHIGKESSQQVKALIEYLKPQVVFVELCPSRKTYLRDESMEDHGREFRVAYEEAMKYGGTVVLGDRSVEITSWRESVTYLPRWNMINLSILLFELVFRVDRQSVSFPIIADLFKAVYMSIVKKMEIDDDGQILKMEILKMVMEKIDDDTQILTMELKKMVMEMDIDNMALLNDEINRLAPIEYVDLNERDQYMSAILLQVAREHNSVVAVVGKAHLPGICKNWKQPIEMERLLSLPSENIVGDILTYIGATVAAVAIISWSCR